MQYFSAPHFGGTLTVNRIATAATSTPMHQTVRGNSRDGVTSCEIRKPELSVSQSQSGHLVSVTTVPVVPVNKKERCLPKSVSKLYNSTATVTPT
jgi:hypothetical protein